MRRSEPRLRGVIPTERPSEEGAIKPSSPARQACPDVAFTAIVSEAGGLRPVRSSAGSVLPAGGLRPVRSSGLLGIAAGLMPFPDLHGWRVR